MLKIPFPIYDFFGGSTYRRDVLSKIIFQIRKPNNDFFLHDTYPVEIKSKYK